MSLANVVKVAIIGDERELKKAAKEGAADLKKVGDAGEGSTSKLGKFAQVAGAGLAGGLAVGVAAVGFLVHGGDELNESQDQLANTLKNVGSSLESQLPWLKKAQSAGEKLGFTNIDINQGYEQLVSSLGNTKDAQRLLGVTEDLAAKKHISLKDAAIAVAKAQEGQLKPLKALGIDVGVAAGGAVKLAAAETKLKTAHFAVKLVETAIHDGRLKGKAAADALAKANLGVLTAQSNYNTVASAGDKIIGALSDRIKGSAVTASDSLAGKTAALKAKFSDFTDHIGQVLIPILLALASFVVDKVVPALGVAEQWIVNVGVPAVVSFGLHIAEIYTRYAKPTIDAIVQAFTGFIKQIAGIFELVRDVFTGKWSNIGADLKLIVTGIVQEVEGILGGIASSVGRALGNAAGALWSWLQGLPKAIGGYALSMVQAGEHLGSSILSGIVSGISGAVSGIADIARQIYDAFAGFVNHHVIDPFKNYGFSILGKHFHPFDSLPDLPIFDDGGKYRAPGGQTHGLAWLEDGETVLTSGQMGMAGAGARGGNIIQHFHAPQTPSQIAAAQRRYDRQNGKR